MRSIQKEEVVIVGVCTTAIHRELLITVHYRTKFKQSEEKKEKRQSPKSKPQKPENTSRYEHLSLGEQWDREVDDRKEAMEIGHEWH